MPTTFAMNLLSPSFWLAILLSVAVTFGAGAYTAHHYDIIKAKADALEAQQEAAKQLEAERKRGNDLADDLEAEKRNIKTKEIEVIREIPKFTTVYVENANEAPKPIPPSVVTWGAVRLYDTALRPDLLPSAREFAYPPGASGLTRSPAQTADILAIHAINAARYAECRSQLNKLIDFELGRPTSP